MPIVRRLMPEPAIHAWSITPVRPMGSPDEKPKNAITAMRPLA